MTCEASCTKLHEALVELLQCEQGEITLLHLQPVYDLLEIEPNTSENARNQGISPPRTGR